MRARNSPAKRGAANQARGESLEQTWHGGHGRPRSFLPGALLSDVTVGLG